MPGEEYRAIPLAFERLTAGKQRARLAEFHDSTTRRRTVRHYSDEPVPDSLIDQGR
jgi:hypothetical protein